MHFVEHAVMLGKRGPVIGTEFNLLGWFLCICVCLPVATIRIGVRIFWSWYGRQPHTDFASGSEPRVLERTGYSSSSNKYHAAAAPPA